MKAEISVLQQSLDDQQLPNEPISHFKLSLTHKSCFFPSLTCLCYPTNEIIFHVCLLISNVKFSPPFMYFNVTNLPSYCMCKRTQDANKLKSRPLLQECIFGLFLRLTGSVWHCSNQARWWWEKLQHKTLGDRLSEKKLNRLHFPVQIKKL